LKEYWEGMRSGEKAGMMRKEVNMVGKPLFVRAEWDEEARVWVATSDDVPGLATEEKTIEGLVEKLKIMIPELLEANGESAEAEIPFEILTRRFEMTQRTNC
jgi:predicted RNase H-like HicB family nuclease